MIRVALSFALMAALTGLLVDRAAPTTERASEPEDTCSNESSSHNTLGDKKMKRLFQTKLTQLMAAGKTTDPKTFTAQLTRTRHELKLGTPRKEEMSGADLYKQVKQSVLMVGSLYDCGKCAVKHPSIASGFIISAEGHALTNAHVVEKFPTRLASAAMDANLDVHPIKEILAVDGANDLALIKLEGSGFKPLPLRGDVETGERIYVLSNPSDRYFYLSTGIVCRVFPYSKTGKKNLHKWLNVDADYARGSSGAPCIDSRGNVVGIVSSTRSVYYKKSKTGEDQRLQMVFKDLPGMSAALAMCAPNPE